MRPNHQNNKRMRGRNRSSGGKGPNPLSRSYESNGPDVKIRGTAQHVAEKYLQLGRDAQASGDPVMAENYLQHAEHYLRLIAAAQEQFRQQNPGYRPFESEASEEEGDEETGYVTGTPQLDMRFPHQEGEGDFQPRAYQQREPREQPQPREQRDYQPREQRDYQPREQRDYQLREQRDFQPRRDDRLNRRGPRPDQQPRGDFGRPEGVPRQDYGRQDLPRDVQQRDVLPRDVQPREQREFQPRFERPERGDRPERRERPAQERQVQERPAQERPAQERPIHERPVQERPVQEPAVEPTGGLPAFITAPVRQPTPDAEPALLGVAPMPQDGDSEAFPVKARRRRVAKPRPEGAPLPDDAPAGE